MRIPLLPSSLIALVAASFWIFTPGTNAVGQSSSSPAQVNRIADHADMGPSVRLPGHLPAWVNTSRDAGGVPDSQEIGITVMVARAPAVQKAFEQLLEDQQNPNSPRYHQWLTPQQIGTLYGPTQHDLDALTGWLAAKNLRIQDIGPSRVLIHASGPAATVAAAFQTKFRMFNSLGKAHYSIATAPAVPAALAPVLSGITGLTEIELRPMSHIEPLAKPGLSQPQYTSSKGNHYLLPGDFATIFNIGPLYTANIKGAGQKVAIIGQAKINIADVTDFEMLSGLPTNTPNIIVPTNGIAPPASMGDEGESDLDLQRVIGVAPLVTADLVASGTVNGNQGIIVAAEYEVNTLLDPVLTLSYGACEANATATGVDFFSTLFSQAAAEGISVFVSSADSAAATCDQAFSPAPMAQQLSINFICSNPYTTCVGGTQFNDTASPGTYWGPNGAGFASALGYIPEGAWNEPGSANSPIVAGSGGGVSTFVTKPSYQAGPGVPADGFRDVPDVSFPAAGHDGYVTCQSDVVFTNGNGSCAGGGFALIASGTSAAAPGWAGVAALLNQKLGGKGQGNLNPLIYRIGNQTTANPFHDITPATAGITPCDLTIPSICNNSTPGPNSFTGGLAGYAVTPGYDLVTGWGSIDVNAFVAAAASQATLTPTTATLTATPTTITTAKTVVFTTTVTGSGGPPTGTVQFTSNGAALGAPVTLVNGVAISPAASFPTIGTYTISATYSGSSTFADSAAPALLLNVTASGTTPSAATLTATATTVLASVPVGFSVTVSGTGGTPTGFVQFTLNGAKDGPQVALVAGKASLPAATLPAGTDTVTAFYSGDNTFASTTSNIVVVTATTLASNTTVTLSAPTVNANGYVNVAGSVTPVVAGGPTPTGTIALIIQGQVLQSFALTNGSVVVTLYGGLPLGSFAISYAYSGDLNYGPSQSADVTLTVTSSYVATYKLTPANGSVTDTAGTAATDLVTVSSGDGYNGTIGLSCAVAYSGTGFNGVLPTCSASPASVVLGTSGNSVNPSVTTTVTLNTVAAHASKAPGQAANHSNLFRSLGGSAMAGLLFLLIPGVGRRRSFGLTWSALASLLLLASLAGLSGCGSGGGAPSYNGTPAGSYSVTVTGTGSVTTTFTLTVQ